MVNLKSNQYVRDNELDVSLMAFYVAIELKIIDNKIIAVLKLYSDSKEIAKFDFKTLEEALLFTENVVAKNRDVNEIINAYEKMHVAEKDLSDTYKIFREMKKISYDQEDIRLKIENINNAYKKVIQSCPHEVVFKYLDNQSRKVQIDGNYFCPCCGLTRIILDKDEFEKSEFKKSNKIIDLSELSLIGNSEILSIIQNDVINSYELYYNNRDNVDRLFLRIKELLKDYQYFNDDNLIKILKNKKSNKNSQNKRK